MTTATATRRIPVSPDGETIVSVTLPDGRTVDVCVRMDFMANGRVGPATHTQQGRIIIPRSQAEVDETIARWRSLGAQPVAHDLECAASPTVPNGTGLHPHLGTIRLAQFGVADGGEGRAEALVVDTWRYDPAAALELLADEDWPTVIHFAQMETRWVGYRYGIRIENLWDTRHASKLIYDRYGFIAQPLEEDLQRLAQQQAKVVEWVRGFEDDAATYYAESGDLETAVGVIRLTYRKSPPADRGIRHALGVVALRELGIELDKTQQNSNWDAVRLTGEQLKYAGEDVLSLLDLWARFEPMLLPEDREEMARAARKLNDKAVGLSEQEAAERNYLDSIGELDPPLDENARRIEPDPKGCESARALRMIGACRTSAELDKLVKALPYMRIHFTNRERVQAALVDRHAELAAGLPAPRPVKVRVAEWEQPF